MKLRASKIHKKQEERDLSQIYKRFFVLKVKMTVELTCVFAKEEDSTFFLFFDVNLRCMLRLFLYGFVE